MMTITAISLTKQFTLNDCSQ